MLQKLASNPEAPRKDGAATGAYQAALAHSRRVKRLRVLLPVAALAISAIFIGITFIRSYLPENLTVQSARIENGKIVMESPAIAGRNERGISYSLTATRALQDVTDPNMLSLENVKAAMPMSGDVIARVVATAGVFDRSADRMNMTAPFEVNLSNGITANFQSARLDIPGGFMESVDPVNIKTNDAAIVAKSMKISDNGKTITFTGQVQVNLTGSALKQQDNQSPAQ
ncbi:LPS export ABC transporter periplasmic protein LptC [Rhizobium sp. FKY42]|uniref:LPS export ABC transporter periplasmic protein LptC n=1 Tax=Rhizobium sp. FKY42 TaxID=2562310 RepID=UPI0010C129D5|nr:LPS export ABC transporter periplasmic protein LptC [Rhizobium sp. FKY42]